MRQDLSRRGCWATTLGRGSVLVVLALCVSPQAEAATVTIPVVDSGFQEIRYVAGPGERNRVVVDWETDGVSVTLSDAGANIDAPEELCARTGIHTVRCHVRPTNTMTGLTGFLRRVTADLGDGDDRLVFTGFPENTRPTVVDAGSGDDEVIGSRDRPAHWDPQYGPFEEEAFDGGPGDDRLVGSFGRDRLEGGGGRDSLMGLAGDDVLSDGDRDGASRARRPGPDVLDGGPGFDTVSYARRRRPVLVDLGHAAGNGARGERDVLRGLEAGVGGEGGDRLASAASSRLREGFRYSSRLEGGAGRDRLVGRSGVDELLPGGGADRVSCGAGVDAIAGGLSARDVVLPGCERARVDGMELDAYPVATGPAAAVHRINCPLAGDRIERCGGTVRYVQAARPHLLLALGTFPVGTWRPRRVGSEWTAVGRVLAARPRGVMATVRIQGRNLPRLAWTIQLRITRRQAGAGCRFARVARFACSWS